MKRYVILEDEICYDNDDYGVWGAVLYDTQEKKRETTTYGHGQDMKQRAESCTLEEAIEEGLDLDEVIKSLYGELHINIAEAFESIALSSDRKNITAIPVKVVGGRKFKGLGYLVYGKEVKCKYGWGAYHDSYDRYPVIYDPLTMTENVVNSFSYLEYDRDYIEEMDDKILESIERTPQQVRNLAHYFAYKMSYASCDSRNARSFCSRLGCKVADFITIPEEVKKAMSIIDTKVEAGMKVKQSAFKEEKMAQLREWVKNNTDKQTEEDVEELALRIYNKRYA